MNLSEDRITFRQRKPGSNPYRMLLWASLILAGLWLRVQLDRGEVSPLFKPTPTPTRAAISFAQEGQALFAAGNLNASILAYQEAIAADPTNSRLMAELAQIMVYSSALLTTDSERENRLEDAHSWINQAVELTPRDSYVHAVRAFVLDWNANPNLVDSETREDLLFQAENAAVQATELDRQNLLAQVYYAEVLLDQQKWDQARQTMNAVLEKDPQLMDAYRVQGLVMETFGLYRDAIAAYETAASFAPNLTFLYLYIGYNYRQLQVYNRALEYFDRAVSINNAISVQDPIPYIAIAKTYAQQGEFFVAALNAERALEINPTDPNTYGQLGIIYVQARNYETAMPVLRCATYGCGADENEVGEVAVIGLPLTSLEVAFYYLQYGSVLAALNFCPEARPVLDQVEASYGSNPVIADIVAENRQICLILGGS